MFSVTLDQVDFRARTSALVNRHLPQIEVWALNWTGGDVLTGLQDRMRVQFDRPTRWTLNAFHVRWATKAAPTAIVQERPSVGRRHYLKVQESGGARPQTALERLLEARVVSDQILRAAIPTAAARLDAYGNWSTGERNQVLSAIRAQRDQAANATERSTARGARRGRASYFVPRNGGLSPGVWKRTTGGDLSKVLNFAPVAPVYAPRLGFEDVAARIYADRLSVNLARAFRRALDTAN